MSEATPAGVGQLLLCDLDEGQHGFLHEGAEPQAELAGEVAHLPGQRGAQVLDHLQVVRHGRREVHQVVDVHGVVLRLLNPDLEGHRNACAGDEEEWDEGWDSAKGLLAPLVSY